ncbi:MAG TPA: response regulator [Actinomycetota bacterium]|nr:response regulator [Actinomycetota bacterium]
MSARSRVLAVDDDKLIRMEMRLMLGREGLEVDVAATCAEARRLLGEHRYDVVLTDVDLPDASGFQVLEDAIRIDPTIPVILLTASSTLISQEQARRAGAMSLLLKPFCLKDVVAEVRRAVLEHHPETRRLGESRRRAEREDLGA